jgi:hypothetical protein
MFFKGTKRILLLGLSRTPIVGPVTVSLISLLGYMDYAYQASPYVLSDSGSDSSSLLDMDYAYRGRPYVGYIDS